MLFSNGIDKLKFKVKSNETGEVVKEGEDTEQNIWWDFVTKLCFRNTLYVFKDGVVLFYSTRDDRFGLPQKTKPNKTIKYKEV